ncbi:MAG TPA: chemotaxis protein CheC [Candidatus Lokiarchaeia archaeon]|nr:chemotaxis protein CheC [Candidatus Lokiarchaeia archaeon]
MANTKKPGFDIDNQLLDYDQSDFLRELGNIGSGNAITALSRLTGKNVNISLPSVQVVDFYEVMAHVKNAETELFGIISNIDGKVKMVLVHLYSKNAVITILQELMGANSLDISNITSVEELEGNTKDIILEIGNIVTGHYASALANLTGQTLLPDVPILVFDHVNAIMDGLIARSAEKFDKVLLISTQMMLDEQVIDGDLLFLPDAEGLEALFTIMKKLEN